MRVRLNTFVPQFLLLLLAVMFAALAAVGNAGPAPTATWSRGVLTVAIAYQRAQPGPGRLITELVDPEDQVLGRTEQKLDLSGGEGVWQQKIAISQGLSLEEVVWQRVRYRFVYDDRRNAPISGVEAVSRILRRPVVHILGQTEYLSGSEAAIRVLVSDAAHQNTFDKDAAVSGTVRAELLIPQSPPRLLFSGRLNQRGTVAAQFRFPAGLEGQYDLRFVADTPIGSSEFVQAVVLKDAASILLTTEKPLYQPGQTIHARALALNRDSHQAMQRKLTFEVEDGRGNKVFKQETATDTFGIAAAEFVLADEVNEGTYHLRALTGKNVTTAEIAFNVERYVLPKFKVAVEFAQKDNKPRRDYRPGDHVTGTVRANYFFGKPVDHADINLKIAGMDVEVFEAASAHGTTDQEGAFHFDLKLPAYFAGRSSMAGVAAAFVEATVKDAAGHAESRNEPITVSRSALLLTAVPEGGTLIPHVENQVFLLSAYPDGTPARTSLTVHVPGERDQRLTSDGSGLAIVHLVPGANKQKLHAEADDHLGNHVTMDVPLETREGADQILLRVEHALVKAGEPLQLKLLATRSQGSAYIDVVRNGQTILTRDLDLRNGQAELSLTATPEMAGTLDIDAYLIGRDAQVVVDHRLVFVQPADELRIETKADAAIYRPGGEARIRFRVTDAHRQGVSAALGVQVVDEAVFALAEKKPGFAKVFFYLEQEAMKPRYEIHSLSLANAVSDEQDTAARALFSATEMIHPARLDTEFGRALPQDRYYEYEQRYRAVFMDQVRDLTEKLTAGLRTDRAPDVISLFRAANARDAWDAPLRMEPAGWSQGTTKFFLIRSAGPDGEFETGDDLMASVVAHSGRVQDSSEDRQPLNAEIEHDRGPFTQRAAASGTVQDPTGAAIMGATITLHEMNTNGTRTTHADADGRFAVSDLSPGRYRAVISSPGFKSRSGVFTLQARDQAILSTQLKLGSVAEAVTVEPAPPMPMVMMARAGGVMGGVLGGVGRMNAPAAMAGPRAVDSAEPAQAKALTADVKPSAAAATHVRSYFPEALYINPEIITDGQGNASITIPVADSITTWRMAMLASTASGSLGSATSSLKVFQDFFVDLDLPVTLTQGDQVSLPIAVYNYSGARGEVHLQLQPEDWFSLDHDAAKKSVSSEPDRVGSAQFTLTARRIGKFKLTLSAHMPGAASRDDIVVREIEVIPNGREQNVVFNGRLEKTIAHDIHFADSAIPDASSVVVRLYPGPLSQIMEGMDSILSMPGGCFEQTSSSTYPNVLALDYMKRTGKLTPETHAKAEGYIANGYQRLLTFEVPGGGFSWFGQAPANKILTAYGLMEFSDMAKVSEVDPRLIERTRDWLVNQQQPDGSWKPDTSFINEGATNRFNSDVVRITAYIARSLVDTGFRGPAVEKAKEFLDSHRTSAADPYTLAVVANFAVEYGQDRAFTGRSMQALVDARTEKGEQVSWTSEETGVYSTGTSAAIETTGLATQALLKWGQASEIARKALNFISASKQASGAWGTTQATITALRALVLATQLSASDVQGVVHIVLNGKDVETLTLSAKNNDLFHQFVFKGVDARQPVAVQLGFAGKGSLAYQVVGRSFIPWENKAGGEPLSIHVAYDRTRLAENDIATETVTIQNNLPKTANMVMVDLGIAPGFELLSEDLQTLQEQAVGDGPGRLEKFSLTATQAILYFNGLGPRQEVSFKVRLRAKYPIRARTFQSRLYEYYDPEVSSIAAPVRLEVR